MEQEAAEGNLKKSQNKKAFIAIITFLVLLGGAAYLLLVKEPTTFLPSSLKNSTSPNLPLENTHQKEVTITKEGFSPKNVVIKVGDQLVIINKDIKSHVITSTHISEDAETVIAPNQTITVPFDKNGTFRISTSLFRSEPLSVTVE